MNSVMLSELRRFKGIHLGQRGIVVGKGPSLDQIWRLRIYPDDVLLCVNEAIHPVEAMNLPNSTYVFQQDEWINTRCVPRRATHIISRRASHWNRSAVVYDPAQFGLKLGALTAQIALKFAALMGIKKVTMFAFDACVNKKTQYASCIGHVSYNAGRKPDRFIGYSRLIETCLSDFEVEWKCL